VPDKMIEFFLWMAIKISSDGIKKAAGKNQKKERDGTFLNQDGQNEHGHPSHGHIDDHGKNFMVDIGNGF